MKQLTSSKRLLWLNYLQDHDTDKCPLYRFSVVLINPLKLSFVLSPILQLLLVFSLQMEKNKRHNHISR